MGISWAAAEIGSLVSDTWKKNVSDPIDEWNKDREEREKEEVRQAQVNRTQELHANHDKIREQYGLKKGKRMELTNNSNIKCDVIFVNKFNANDDKKGAIKWAKEVIGGSYVGFGMLDKLKTKVVELDVESSVELVDNEFKEYFIVLHMGNDRWMVVGKEHLDQGVIYVKQTFCL